MAVHCLVPLIMIMTFWVAKTVQSHTGEHGGTKPASVVTWMVHTYPSHAPIPSLTPWQHDLSWLRFWLTWLKFSQSEANPQKLRKFCHTKFLSIRYLLFAEQEHMLLIHEGLALIYQQRTTSKFDKTEVLRLSNMYPTIPCVSSNGGGLSWQVCH